MDTRNQAPVKSKVRRHSVIQPEGYRLIPLTKGQNAMVDVNDWAELSQWNWAALWIEKSKTFYAIRTGRDENGNKIQVLMHRQIMGNPAELDVDHKNRDTLDNRKQNLRPCEHNRNIANQKRRINSTTGFKGVYFHKQVGRWCARIKTPTRRISLGLYTSPELAARAYDKAAIEHFGEFARLNFDGE